MRLTLSAMLGTVLFASPVLAHQDHQHPMMPHPGAAMPPPPPYYDGPADPRLERGHGEWMERCHRFHDRDDRHGARSPDGCGYPVPYGYGHPGAYMGYAVPMMMVPVLRSKPCREVVEEIVEEVVPPRRRVIRPRVVPDKRVPLRDKRVPASPSKRIAY
jgi:hypothetical protein